MPCSISIDIEETDNERVLQSPLYEIIEYIFHSIIAIAPEKTNRILGQIFGHEVKFSLHSSERFVFSVKPSERKISISLRALEFFWATSYAYYVIYQTAALPENQAKGMLSLLDNPDTHTAAKVLQWTLDRETSKVPDIPWPTDFPRSQRSPDSTDRSNPCAEFNAQELFLCAVGWILHHELAHIQLQHGSIGFDSLREETEADELATEMLLKGITNRDLILKRGLGITNALLALCCRDLEIRKMQRSNVRRTHPKVADRLYKALGHRALADQCVIVTFAIYILKLHFDHLGIEINQREYPDLMSCLSDYCFILAKYC